MGKGGSAPKGGGGDAMSARKKIVYWLNTLGTRNCMLVSSLSDLQDGLAICEVVEGILGARVGSSLVAALTAMQNELGFAPEAGIVPTAAMITIGDADAVMEACTFLREMYVAMEAEEEHATHRVSPVKRGGERGVATKTGLRGGPPSPRTSQAMAAEAMRAIAARRRDGTAPGARPASAGARSSLRSSWQAGEDRRVSFEQPRWVNAGAPPEVGEATPRGPSPVRGRGAGAGGRAGGGAGGGVRHLTPKVAAAVATARARLRSRSASPAPRGGRPASAPRERPPPQAARVSWGDWIGGGGLPQGPAAAAPSSASPAPKSTQDLARRARAPSHVREQDLEVPAPREAPPPRPRPRPQSAGGVAAIRGRSPPRRTPRAAPAELTPRQESLLLWMLKMGVEVPGAVVKRGEVVELPPPEDVVEAFRTGDMLSQLVYVVTGTAVGPVRHPASAGEAAARIGKCLAALREVPRMRKEWLTSQRALSHGDHPEAVWGLLVHLHACFKSAPSRRPVGRGHALSSSPPRGARGAGAGGARGAAQPAAAVARARAGSAAGGGARRREAATPGEWKEELPRRATPAGSVVGSSLGPVGGRGAARTARTPRARSPPPTARGPRARSPSPSPSPAPRPVPAAEEAALRKWLRGLGFDLLAHEERLPLLQNPLRNGVLLCDLVSLLESLDGGRGRPGPAPGPAPRAAPRDVASARTNIQQALEPFRVFLGPSHPLSGVSDPEAIMRGDRTAIWGLLRELRAAYPALEVAPGAGGASAARGPPPPGSAGSAGAATRGAPSPRQPWRSVQLPYRPEEIRRLEASLMRWILHLGVLPEGTSPASFSDLLDLMRDGALLCDAVAAIDGRAVLGVTRPARTAAAAAANVAKAVARLAAHRDMSRRFLWHGEQIARGERAVVTGLLEDIHRYYDGMPAHPELLRPGEYPPYVPSAPGAAPATHKYAVEWGAEAEAGAAEAEAEAEEEEAWYPVPEARGDKGTGGAGARGAGQRNPHVTPHGAWGAPPAPTAGDWTPSPGEDLEPSPGGGTASLGGGARGGGAVAGGEEGAIRRWLAELGCPAPPRAPDLGAALADGTLLCRLVGVLERAELPGWSAQPSGSAQRLQNLRLALRVLRQKNTLDIRYLFSEHRLCKGDADAAQGLLGDVRRAYRSVKPASRATPHTGPGGGSAARRSSAGSGAGARRRPPGGTVRGSAEERGWASTLRTPPDRKTAAAAGAGARARGPAAGAGSSPHMHMGVTLDDLRTTCGPGLGAKPRFELCNTHLTAMLQGGPGGGGRGV